MSKTIDTNRIIPAWLIWIQCTAFVILYAFWMLPEIVGFRNTALVVGAIASTYPIYQYRYALFQKNALSIWCIVALFIWAIVHFLFFSQDYASQLLELNRIWKYAAIGAIFAFGLGLSLASKNFSFGNNLSKQSSPYWPLIFFGLATPVLIYLIKYVLTNYARRLGIVPPEYLMIPLSTDNFYVPKSDFVAFCLPPLAIALGQIQVLILRNQKFMIGDYGKIVIYMILIAATLFLFYSQNIKNGMAYATICIIWFVVIIFFKKSYLTFWKKIICLIVAFGCLAISLHPHIEKNSTWKTLLVDAKIALQTERYDHWKYAGAQGYPNNELGEMVSITNYERVAWFKIGNQVVFQNPFGYGLIEDSFKRIAKAKWPEVSPNLSHTHSGWLDLLLAIGYPGFFFVMVTLVILLFQSRYVPHPWYALVLWGLIANILLWITTEVSATVTFAALIFWLCWGAGLCVLGSSVIEKK